MVGRLTQEDRFELIDLLGAMVKRDGQKLVEAIRLITTGDRDFDPRSLERDILDILDHHFAVPVSELNVGRMLLDITDLLRHYRLKIPPDLFIMIKGLITAEGTVRQIDPQINFAAELEAHMRRLATLRYGPGILWRSLRSGLSRFVAAPGKFPQRVLEIVEKLEKGDLNIRFQHANLSAFRGTLEEIYSRLSLAVIIAAMIIGSSMVITTGVRPLLFGYPAFGIIGYVISGMLGLWLIIDILRSRR
jgi:ubiquinone biosynthesis protein